MEILSSSNHPIKEAKSYWGYCNSLIGYNFKGNSMHEIKGIGLKSGLSYLMFFEKFAIYSDISLYLGPYTKMKGTDISIDFVGFGGGVGVLKDLSFIHLLENFSIKGSLQFSDLSGSSSDSLAFKVKTTNYLVKAEKIADYSLRLKNYAFNFALSYNLGSKNFTKMSRGDVDPKDFIHSFSLGFSVPIYAKYKSNYSKTYSKSYHERMREGGKFFGSQFLISYNLYFL